MKNATLISTTESTELLMALFIKPNLLKHYTPNQVEILSWNVQNVNCCIWLYVEQYGVFKFHQGLRKRLIVCLSNDVNNK